jgi:hypothetical protein
MEIGVSGVEFHVDHRAKRYVCEENGESKNFFQDFFKNCVLSAGVRDIFVFCSLVSEEEGDRNTHFRQPVLGTREMAGVRILPILFLNVCVAYKMLGML